MLAELLRRKKEGRQVRQPLDEPAQVRQGVTQRAHWPDWLKVPEGHAGRHLESVPLV